MDKHIERLLFEALSDNILPVTGSCNLSCIFCSHRYNPPEALVYNLPPLDYGLLSNLVKNLDPSRKIVIGESVTRLREGEPFTHKKILDLLKRIRGLYPDTLIQITTNGTLLTKDKLKEISALDPVELVFSLNSISAKGRNKLCGDSNPNVAVSAVKNASDLNVPFHGSVVAMPHIVGYEDLRQTVFFLDKNNARSIRVFIPGFTSYTPKKFHLSRGKINEIRLFISELREEVRTPLLLEPPLLEDTKAVIEGVLKETFAEAAGLLRNDLIKEVNGIKPLCRVDAYNMLFDAHNPEVTVERNGAFIKIKLQKKVDSSSGIAVSYDINPAHINLLKKHTKRDKNILLLTSEAAEKVWHAVASLIMSNKSGSESKKQLKITPVPSNFWGGSVICAGLLTVSDFRSAIESEIKYFKPDIVMLPPISFDRYGQDITGESFRELTDSFAKDIKFIV